MNAEQTRAAKVRMMRYKRPALASMGYDEIREELEEITEEFVKEKQKNEIRIN